MAPIAVVGVSVRVLVYEQLDSRQRLFSLIPRPISEATAPEGASGAVEIWGSSEEATTTAR